MSPNEVRALVARHGTVRSQSPEEWRGPFPIPTELARYYEDIGPAEVTIESYGNPFFLPALAGLWEFQRGYRWHARTGEPCQGWQDDWLVVGTDFGGAFILCRRSWQVLYALHGGGTWWPTAVFGDLSTMAACLATLGSVVSDAGHDFTDEDCLIRPVHLRRAASQLGQVLGSDARAHEVLATLGWT